MQKQSLIIVSSLFFVLISCSHQQKTNTKKVVGDTLTIAIDNSKINPPAPANADTTIIEVKSERISGALYTAILKSNDTVYILKKEDTILKVPGVPVEISFEHFDRDGYKDLLLTYFSNAPGVQDLFLFDKHAQTFKQVDDFSSFPASLPIKGTKYYYSYHKSGCADMNWDSDLFYIKNYKAIRIGNIAGYECENRHIKDGVYIHRIKGKKETMVKTLSISVIHRKDFKWGFIKDYWTKNYKFFQ